jgi:hypothetical protein
MTKAQALTYITSTFEALDETSAEVLADFAESLVQIDVPLKLTTKERAGIARSRKDFQEGKTLTPAQYKKEMSLFWKQVEKKYPAYA